MVGVCFHREQHWEQDQWSFVFSNFGITDIWERGFDGNKDLKLYQPSQKISKASELPDVPLVVLQHADSRYIKGVECLIDFKHPQECIYFFGGTHMNLTKDEVDVEPDHLVYIPSVKHEMYSHAAGYITLYDRLLKKNGECNHRQ